jgi:hypothetical protein
VTRIVGSVADLEPKPLGAPQLLSIGVQRGLLGFDLGNEGCRPFGRRGIGDLRRKPTVTLDLGVEFGTLFTHWRCPHSRE